MVTTMPLKQAALNTMYNQPAHASLAVAAMHCIAANQLPLAAELCRAALLHVPANQRAAGTGGAGYLRQAIAALDQGDGEGAVDWLLEVA
jgi:hypothetical protein